jgi:hypothetical protein
VTTCPFCGKDNPLADSITGKHATPTPGDVSLCIGCGEWAVFTEDGVRKPNSDEYDNIVSDTVCQRARSAWLLTMKKEAQKKQTD